MEQTKLNKLKVGDYFKFVDKNGKMGATVYVRDTYDRSTKKYGIYKFEDVNDYREVAGTRAVTTDFIF